VTQVRRLVAAIVAFAVVGGTLALGFALAAAGPGTCPTALLQGTLVEREGTLAVASVPGGAVVDVAWPFGYGVERRDGTLTLTRVFMPVAREGDQVSIGGGSDGSGFQGCGPIALGLTIPAEPHSDGVPATLRVTGTALQPCIPPPSGCGYWVVVAWTGGSARAPLAHNRSYESAANGDPAPLTLGDGLPRTLAPGVHELRFEVGEYSDVASGDGGPQVGVACAQRIDVSEDTALILANVIYNGDRCTVEVVYTERMRETS
jgi:hypothetical protein